MRALIAGMGLMVALSGAMSGGTYELRAPERHVGWAIPSTGIQGGRPVRTGGAMGTGKTGIAAARRTARKRRNRLAAKKRGAA